MNSVLLYSDNPTIGGVYQFNHSLLCKLATSGYQVASVQIQHSDQMIEKQKQLGVSQFWLDSEFVTGYSRSYTDLTTPKKLISEVQPDLIIFSDGWTLGNFAAKQVAIELNIPYIIVVGFVDPSCATVAREDGVSYVEAARYHYTMAKAVVAVSQENLHLLHTLFKIPELCGQVIHYGRPKEFFTPPDPITRQRLREELKLPDDAIVCFSSARLAQVKGYDLQLEAIKILKNTPVWEKLHFVWAGTGIKGETVESRIKQQILELDVSDKIHLLGERNDIPDLLTASDIYILPSRAEGMPLAIMEAMAKGLPVIASSVSGIPEELGETGKLLPDPNINPQNTIIELASAITAWATNADLRRSVGDACCRRANLLFTEERMLREYIQVLKQVAQHESPNPVEPFPIDQAWVQTLQNQMKYACHVWNAWYAYSKDNLTDMQRSLKESAKITPFLPTATILNWIEMFTQFSREQGNSFDAYSLCLSEEWQKLLSTML